jgi:hypothetical protein
MFNISVFSRWLAAGMALKRRAFEALAGYDKVPRSQA